MTNEEAIKILSSWAECKYKPTHDAACIAIAALRAQQDAETNDPLTLDVLREMDGEPVWVVQPQYALRSFWMLVDAEDESATNRLYCATFEDYGEEWLAYRRKPKEEK